MACVSVKWSGSFADESPQSLASKDGNGSVLDRISAGFEFRGFGFGYDFSPMVFGFGPPKTYRVRLWVE